jgi:(2Fe-2S) ferredoxin
LSLRERYLLVCGNVRPEDDPRGCCGRKCPGLRDRFKAAIEAAGLKTRARALTSSCLDECATGPTVCVMPDNVWYRGVAAGDVDEIVESHLRNGRPVERLRSP